MKEFYVVIYDLSGEQVDKMGPMPESKANRVENGVNINLNHYEFYTDIVEVKSEQTI